LAYAELIFDRVFCGEPEAESLVNA
jgi:hypothetical protein